MRCALYAFWLLISAMLIGCDGDKSNENTVEITIHATNPHPYLIDHDRACVITLNGKEVNRFDLYVDTGTGLSISNLYDLPDAEQFVLIDNNGMWFFVDKKTGRLVHQEWHWEKTTPDHFLGTYLYQQVTRSYLFKSSAVQDELNIYLVKDPQDF